MVPVRFFPYTVAGLELCAGVNYLLHKDWRGAIIWLGYGIAAIALAGAV